MKVVLWRLVYEGGWFMKVVLWWLGCEDVLWCVGSQADVAEQMALPCLVQCATSIVTHIAIVGDVWLLCAYGRWCVVAVCLC